MRADGLPTQYMRSLAYCVSAPGLEGMVSMQVCGTEWVVACRLDTQARGRVETERQRLSPRAQRLSRDGRAAEASGGLERWSAARGRPDGVARAADRRRSVIGGRCAGAHPWPEGVAAQVALGYFLPHPVTPQVDFEPDGAAERRRELRLGAGMRTGAPWGARDTRGLPPGGGSRLSLRGGAVGDLPSPSAPGGGALRADCVCAVLASSGPLVSRARAQRARGTCRAHAA